MKRNIDFSFAILAAIAGICSGFKFSPKNNFSFVFWNTNIGTKSTNKGDYVYLDPSTSPTCLQNANSYCKAVFTQNVVPAYGDHPTTLAVIHTIIIGKLFVP